MIKMTINGREIEVEEGMNLIEAARTIGVEIPHFCYHPALETVGSCRMCQVEIKAPGRPRLDISCRTPVCEGMEVETHSEAAVKARAAVMEFLLANHPLDCPICDKAGECTLQDYQFEHGAEEGAFHEEKRHDFKHRHIGGHIVHDAERCILCTRCVRFMRDYAKDPKLLVEGRGDTSRITIFGDRKLDSMYSGNLADVCPVGALTLEEFRFKVRTWYLAPVASVCPYCSRGCNIHLDIRKNENRLFRVRPRVNHEVNGHFICNEGRFRPLEAVAMKARFLTPLAHGAPGTRDEVLEKAARGLKDAEGGVLVVGSARRTVEELYLARRIFGALEGADFVAADPETEDPDGILRTGENAPNVKALDLFGYRRMDLESLADALEDPSHDALVLLDGAISLSPRMREAFRFIVYMDYVALGAEEMADAALPGRAWFEKEGTFINFENRVQRLRPGLAPPSIEDDVDRTGRADRAGCSKHRRLTDPSFPVPGGSVATGPCDDLEILAALGDKLDGPSGTEGDALPVRAAEVFAAIAGEHPRFEGLDYMALGETGAQLKPDEASPGREDVPERPESNPEGDHADE